MSAINREDAIEAILSRLAKREEPCPPWIYATIRKCLDDLPSLPSGKPLVYDGFYLCDKKPGACPLWERKGWTKCMSKHCNRTSRVDHALKLPDADDGWISVEDRLPKIGNTVLATRFISKDHTYVDMSSYQGQDIGWKSNFDTYYGTNPYKVMAWRPLPKPYKPKEDTQ